MSSKLNHIHFKSIDSTQKYAISIVENLVEAGRLDGVTAITADMQTNGVGKAGVKWESYIGNLHCTFILKLSSNISSVAITQRCTLAVAMTLEEYGVSCSIKWINDLLLNNKKVCGILCDLMTINQAQYLLAGVGINLVWSPSDLPSSTSIVEETGKLLSSSSIVERCGSRLISAIDYSNDVVSREMNRRLAYVGHTITCIDNDYELTGKLLGISPAGLLQVANLNGKSEILPRKILLTE